VRAAGWHNGAIVKMIISLKKEDLFMSNDRSARTVIAVLLITLAMMLVTNYAINERPVLEWWLPALLSIVGVVLALPINISPRRATALDAEPETALAVTMPKPIIRDYDVSALPKRDTSTPVISRVAQPVPTRATIAPAAPVEAAVSLPNIPTWSVTDDTPTDAVPAAPSPEPSATIHNEKIGETPDIVDTPGIPRQTTADEPLVVENVGDIPVAVTPDQPAPTAEPPSIPKVTPDISAAVGDTSAAIAATPGAVVTVQDFIKIDGIGPRIAGVLIAGGIDTFEKLAGATEADLRAMLSTAGIRLAPSLNTWSEQAAFATQNDWASMDAFNAGRK